jgi:hypothetical protein
MILYLEVCQCEQFKTQNVVVFLCRLENRRHIGVTFVSVVGVGVPLSLSGALLKSATISLIDSKLGMHASHNDSKCSARESLLCTS